jgi:hypothetical protein
MSLRTRRGTQPTLVGVATAVSSGPATISAAFGGQTGSAQLTVDTATLSSITVTGPSVLAPGSTANYQALGHYSDQTTQFITGLVTWASTNSSVVSITTGGIANGLSAGSANITAAYQGVTSNFFGVIVTSSPLVSIALTPSTATTYEGVSLQFAATGTFMNGQTQTLTNNVTWASSQPSIATISNVVGQQGFATGVAPGQTSITALFANVVSAPATLTVSNATLVSIAVTPISPIVQHGAQQRGRPDVPSDLDFVRRDCCDDQRLWIGQHSQPRHNSHHRDVCAERPDRYGYDQSDRAINIAGAQLPSGSFAPSRLLSFLRREDFA